MINLLIVDDDPTILEGLSQFISLTFPGLFSVYSGKNGIQAINIMKKTPVHILLSDIKMPLLDGIHLIDILKQSGYGCQILVLSGYDDYPLIRTALKSGACDYLLKPVNFSLLKQALEEIIAALPSLPSVSPCRLCTENFSDYLTALPSQSDFYDIKTKNNPFITQEILKSYLEKTQSYIINMDSSKTKETLEQFFSHLHPDLIVKEDIQDILSQFIYNLMHQNSGMIKIISKYKLSDFDILSCIKNMPTLSQLQNHFIRIILKYIEELQENLNRQDGYLVRQAEEYIQNNYSSELLLEDVAYQFHLHPNYFSRLFRQQTGVTFRDYLRNVRIEKAKEFLADPSCKISHIALLVGYRDTAHFNRAFKELTGTTPSHYRKIGGH